VRPPLLIAALELDRLDSELDDVPGGVVQSVSQVGSAVPASH
jgi:hypothetical protein